MTSRQESSKRISLLIGVVTAALWFATAAVPCGQAQNLEVLYTFGSATGDGGTPASALWRSPTSSILFGTTTVGGDLTCGSQGSGCGTVFQLKPNPDRTWSETVLLKFEGAARGQSPKAALLKDKIGRIWGTTYYGGSGVSGSGVVFTLNAATGGEEVAHDFSGTPDGANPIADLLMDAQGNLYGTTENGGVANFGTIFRQKNFAYKSLYSFTGGADGQYPLGGLVQDKSGKLYGTTHQGGTPGFGTIYQWDPTTKTKTVIYNFSGPPDGSYPVGSLAIDTSGNLYGATANGGDATCDCGIVFLLAPPTNGIGPWNESVKYRFTGGMDGENPETGVVRDSKGNLYGTTLGGGTLPLGFGTIYKVDPDGGETVMWRFTGGMDGGGPIAPLILGLNEKYLYGTASDGGANLLGIVFRIAVP